MNHEQIAVANATSRNAGAVGARAVVPRYVRDTFGDLTDLRVLDFGAGKAAAHAEAMRAAYGCVYGWTVDAVEFGANVNDRHLTGPEMAKWRGSYGVVYASNVLNVQSSYAMLGETIRDVRSFMTWGGRFVCNYPASPRKSELSAGDVLDVLRLYFASVKQVGGTKSAPVWECNQLGSV